MRRLILGLLCLTLMATPALAQQGVPGTLVQQSPTRLDIPQTCVTATAAAGSAATLTIPAQGGQFAYIGFFEVTAYASGALTGAAAANTATFANVTGAPVIKLATKSPAAPATDTGALADRFIYVGLLKSAVPGTATTLTTSAQANMIFNVNACFYYAP